jgi:hypothetical protein
VAAARDLAATAAMAALLLSIDGLGEEGFCQESEA